MEFVCNLCGWANPLTADGFARDEASCAKCQSTVRLRALMHAFTLELFGIPLPLCDFPVMKSIRGLGIGDNRECAMLLEPKLDYRNTFYHQEPHFDIAAPPPERGFYDFVICGDVLEHVKPPVEPAFANLRALLKPHGFLAMTVPYSTKDTTQEHFPDMHESGLATVGGRPALVNRTREGEWQVFDNLVFHGGEGSTLELRLFGEQDLRSYLNGAGFSRIEFATTDYAPFGIVHREICSLPIIAGNEPFRLSRAGVAELMQQYAELHEHARKLDTERLRLNGEFNDRTQWALQLDQEVKILRGEVMRLRQWEASRWIHLGRALGLGPKG